MSPAEIDEQLNPELQESPDLEKNGTTNLDSLEESEQSFRSLGALLLASVILVMLGLGLSQLDNIEGTPITLVGMALFGLAVYAFARGELPQAAQISFVKISNWLGLSEFRTMLLVLSPFISLAAWLSAGDGAQMRSPYIAVGAWLAGMVLLLVGTFPSKRKSSSGGIARREWAILITMTLIAFLLRGMNIEQIPFMVTGDEGASGFSSLQFIEGNMNNIFTVGWFSFPSLYFFLQSLAIRVFGRTILALRILSAIAGSLTIAAVYWYARNTFDRWTAIAASVYLTTFHFHIHFSRIGLNNIWDGLFLVAFSAALWDAYSNTTQSPPRSRFMFAIAGLILGLGQYFYTSIRVVFALLLIWIPLSLVLESNRIKSRLPGVTVMLLGFIVSFLPLGMFFTQHPDQFQAPMARVGIMGDWLAHEAEITDKSALTILLTQVKKAALGFTHTDLLGWYKPESPMLLFIPGSLFLMGIVLLFMRIRDLRHIWLLLWLAGVVAIGALSNSPPASQRLTIVAPAVAVVIGITFSQILSWMQRLLPRYRYLPLMIIGLLLISAMALDLNHYFGEYTLQRRFGDVNTEVATQFARYLDDKPSGTHVYFFAYPRMGYETHPILPFLNPEVEGEDIIEPVESVDELEQYPSMVFAFLPEHLDELERIQEAYPKGIVEEQTGRNGDILYKAYFVSATETP